MSDFRELVLEALAATEIVSATSYAWFGARSPGLPEETVQLMGPASAREYLIYNLQSQLYADFYCAGVARPRLDSPEPPAPPGESPFVRTLSEANSGTGAREPGWAVVREEGGTIVVTRAGLTLWAPRDEVYPANGQGLTSGTPAGVLMPKELLRLAPGFYMALGNAEFPVDGSKPMVRFYWNLRSQAAPWLISELTRRLNAEELAFRVKVVSDPGLYSRCDAGVLYTLREQYGAVAAVVAKVYGKVASGLKPATPALTKPLAPGLGLAEDPGDQSVSFGMSRCRLLAEAIVTAAERGWQEPAQRLAAVEERLAADGLLLDAPYLNAGSADTYELVRA
jgi:hypothetical protein